MVMSSWKLSIGDGIVFESDENTVDITTINFWENQGNQYTIAINDIFIINGITNVAQIAGGTINSTSIIQTVSTINSIGDVLDGSTTSTGTIGVSGAIDNIGSAVNGSLISSTTTITNYISGIMTDINDGTIYSDSLMSIVSGGIDSIGFATDGSLLP